jgi:hypothetical protein
MQHYIQSVHIKLSYFTIQLQSSTHLTYYSHNNQKDLKLNLDRALGGILQQSRLEQQGFSRLMSASGSYMIDESIDYISIEMIPKAAVS